jgi:hypothetical protein
VVAIKLFAFHPASVRPGGSSTATLVAVNCTARIPADKRDLVRAVHPARRGIPAWLSGA